MHSSRSGKLTLNAGKLTICPGTSPGPDPREQAKLSTMSHLEGETSCAAGTQRFTFETVGEPSNRARIELVPHGMASLSNGFANGITFGMTHYTFRFKLRALTSTLQ
jgi:hypothetical protein